MAILGILLISAGAVWYLIEKRSRLQIVDVPNDRSLHSVPMPRTGGIGILAGLAAGILWIAITENSTPVLPWITFALAIAAGVSLADDRWGLRARYRLAAHLIAAAIVAFGARLLIGEIPFPNGTALPLAEAGAVVTVIFIAWMANTFNFMDGIDGIASTMAIFGFAAIAYLAWTGGDRLIACLSAVAVPAVFGFLLFNFPPARIFMGDSGSISLGFLSATLAIAGVSRGVFDIWVPLIIYSPFLADTTVTLLRRAIARKPVWQAHREHFYQRLVLSGLTHRQTLFVEIVLMTAMAGAAIAYSRSAASRPYVLAGVVAVYVVLAIVVSGRDRSPSPAGAPQP